MPRSLTLSLVLFLLLALTISAQQPPTPPSGDQSGPPRGTPGGTPGTGGAPGTPGGNRPVQPTRPSVFGEDRDPFGRSARGLLGRIMPNQGSRLQVELYLDGVRLDTTFTDSAGNFKFERHFPGRRYEIRVILGPGQMYVEEVDFMGAGIPTSIIIRPQRVRQTDAGNPTAGTLISLASLNVPGKAVKEFSKGRELGRKKKYEEAIARLQMAVNAYPKYAEAFNEMGLIYRRQNLNTQAQAMFQKAIEADPQWVFSYLNLASLQLNQNAFGDSLQTSQRVLSLDNTLAPAHFLSAMAHANLGNLEAAEKSALAADRHDHKEVPQLHLLLARIYQARGAEAEAISHLKLYLKENPNDPNIGQARQALENLIRKK